jgi:6-phosphofructokinase 2
MQPILTITLNPALDLAGSVPEVVAGPKMRVADLTVEPGGGGINVARVIHRLGGDVTSLAAFGGAVGKHIAALLDAEGVPQKVIEAPGDTRQSFAVTDNRDRAQYRFVLPGPEWDDKSESAALDSILESVSDDCWVVLSGSQPPGVSAGFPQRLAQALARRGVRLIADTSGDALKRLLDSPEPSSRPAVLRLDHREADALAEGNLRDVADSLDLAASLVERGVTEMAVLARGADGSVLATRDLRLHAIPPEVEVQSAVGAGDSFTGAFALALASGKDPSAALLQGTAAAAAAVITPATELCRPDDVARLLRQCRLDTD